MSTPPPSHSVASGCRDTSKKVNCNLFLFFTTPEGCCMAIERALVSGMRVFLGEGSNLPPTYTHCSAPAPSPVTAASVMNDSAVGPSKRTGGHETNHSCQALIFPWESHLHPPHPSLGTGLPPYPPPNTHPRQLPMLCGCM